MSNYMTVTEVAEHFGVSVWTVRDYIKTGRINAIKFGSNYRIPASEVARGEAGLIR